MPTNFAEPSGMNEQPSFHAFPVITRAISVLNKLGLHARPAAALVLFVKRHQSEVTVDLEGVSADARDIMDLLLLAAHRGTTLLFRARGADAQELLDGIEQLFASRFGEA
jgi:phosphocarrier protein